MGGAPAHRPVTQKPETITGNQASQCSSTLHIHCMLGSVQGAEDPPGPQGPCLLAIYNLLHHSGRFQGYNRYKMSGRGPL